MRDADEILAEAGRAWRDGRRGHRDCLLRVGALVSEYAVAVVASGAGLTAERRQAAGLTRAAAVLKAAASLGVSRAKALSLARVACATAALSGGGGLGGLSYSALRTFAACAARVGGLKASRNAPGATPEALAASQAWCVPARHGWAVALFLEAADGGWTDARVRDEVAARLGRLPRQRRAAAGAPREGTPGVERVVAVATPRDAAEAIFSLVMSSREPAALAAALAALLDGVRTSGRAPSGVA